MTRSRDATDESLGQADPGKEEENEGDDRYTSLAFVFAGAARAFLLGLGKFGFTKGALTFALKKQAFLTLGSRTAAHAIAPPAFAMDDVAKGTGKKSNKWGLKAASTIKGGVLGASVFGIYDWLIFKAFATDTHLTSHIPAAVNEKDSIRKDEVQTIWMQASVSPGIGTLPVVAHFAAGALAGLVQSVIIDAWEVLAYGFVHRHELGKKKDPVLHVKQGINTSLLVRRAVHHSVGFSVLFGTFETVRNSLVSALFHYFSSGDPSILSTLAVLEQYRLIGVDNDGVHEMTIIPMSAAFLAGGSAGVAQYTANHYTRHWKMQAIDSARTSKVFKHVLPKQPSLRALCSPFMPTALCFLAFQYGGEITERWLDDEDTRHPFPVYIALP